VPVLRAAKSGFYLQLVLGLVFTYTDMALDVHTAWLFLGLGLYGTGWAGIGIIGLSLVVQALGSLLIFKQGWKEALWALVGAKPLRDVVRIITGAPPHTFEGATWSHESILSTTKLLEATFENMPQALLQITSVLLLPAAKRSTSMYLSIASSILLVGLMLATSQIDGDFDPHRRRQIPDLYGWAGSRRRPFLKKLALGVGLTLFLAASFSGVVLALAVAAVGAGAGAVASVMTVAFAVYVAMKAWDREFFFFVSAHSMWPRTCARIGAGLCVHFVMFVGLVSFPVPWLRSPGLVNPHTYASSIALVLGVLVPALMLGGVSTGTMASDCGDLQDYTAAAQGGAASLSNWTTTSPATTTVHGDYSSGDGEGCGGGRVLHASVLELAGLGAALLCTAAASGLLFLWGVAASHRGSFYKYMPWRQQTSRDLNLGNEARREQGLIPFEENAVTFFTARDPSYWPSPEDLAANPHFCAWVRQTRDVAGARPQGLTADWEDALPQKYRAVFGVAALDP
jgi:hypothetical protein